MAEEFQAGVCGGNWWMATSRSPFAGTTSPCSMALNDTGGYAWSDMVDMKGRSTTCEETNSVSDQNSMVFQDVQKPQQADSATGSSSILIDSTLQMMGFGFSSPSTTTTSDWNQALLRGSERGESNYNSMLQEDMNSRLNYNSNSSQIQKNWSPKNMSSTGGEDLSNITAFKSINQDFPLDTVSSSSGNCTVTCQGISAGFPVGSSTSYGYPSTVVLQSLFGHHHPDSQPQQSLFNNNQSMNYSSSTANYGTNSCNDQLLPSWAKFSPSMSKQQSWGLHLSNKTHFWNASTAALTDNARPGIFPPSQPQYLLPAFEEKPKCSNLTTKTNIDDVQDSVSVVKKSNSSEPVFKRPRIETPSPLPTFKVRKEKLGDRITALQQLVSPFGKTDTASVLHEAIEYIKFLHDQVSVLSTPYMKNGTTPIQHQQGSDKLKQDTEVAKQDLRSRGLCLVPISSTYPVANETTADFWTPTFGGTFR